MKAATSRSRKQASPDPIARFRRLMSQAQRAGAPLPEAMALATAGRNGRPSVRFVLLKHCDQDGFVFYGDMRSRKGQEIVENPFASLVFYWDAVGKQVRAEGGVAEVSASEADAYWATRPRGSQLAATVSIQSAPLASQEELNKRLQALRSRLKNREVPRPSTWRGFRLSPEAIEFWTRRQYRLHERELFVRRGRGWKRILLYP